MTAYLQPQDTALIIIDMQNDFCHEDGASAQRGLADIAAFQACVPKIDGLIAHARAAGVPVVFVYMTLDDTTKSEAWTNKHGTEMSIVVKDSWGADYYKLYPQPGDAVVEKHRYSGFIGTNLDLILRSMGCKSIVLTGVLTNVCVESTARDGFMLDYNVTLVSDACAGSSPEAHAGTLANIANVFGTVLDAGQVGAVWQAAASPIEASA
ncbi:cysteine hydrolase family protein [Cohnella rhizosphaerae]|uniref:Cysteine hydrolase n=1 Tax=Cohnella rhizosphaerae TaxID=1457232 RepID=A0A9X4KVB8_9BACL|nr:isochorismatase family cysteine hydrolase [Cohnella rhizosphaerae]MDG0811073.1 cysteine hydrolase [Cohnella rhizosphaerae]